MGDSERSFNNETIPPSLPNVAPHSRDAPRLNDVALVEIAKLQNDGEHIKSLLIEIKSDLRDVRDRAIKLEEVTRSNEKVLDETKKKVDKINNWVIGASAVVAFIVVVSQAALRFFPAK